MLATMLALGLATSTTALAADDFERVAQANLPEFLALLAIPNVASEPADIRRNAAFLQASLERRGFRVQQLDNPAQRPLVYQASSLVSGVCDADWTREVVQRCEGLRIHRA